MSDKSGIAGSGQGLRRRDVLTLSSAGTLVAAAREGATGSISQRGVWWHFPSLLEPGPGPWAGFDIYSEDAVSAWKGILNWMRANGLNLVVTQFPPHFKDRILLGWGYHYVIDFDEFPEARTFSPGFVKRNRDRVNRILDYAGRLGIPIYVHDYNFISTKPFVESHDNLLRKWKINTHRGYTSYLSVPDRLRNLRGNLCWREPLLQQFMIACWKETFAKMPGLAGILATPGEANRCFCAECARGARNDSMEELARANRANAWEVTMDFCDQFSRTLKQLNKRPALRTWYAAGLESKLSRETPKAVKYSMFDCFWGGADPMIRRWLEAGHEVWVTKDIYGENAGPIIWNNPRYFREVVNTCRKLGVRSLLAHQNPDFGFASMPLKVQQLNLLCFCYYLQDPRRQDDGWIDGEYQRIFGKTGPKIRLGVEAYSEAVLGITRICGNTKEGFTFLKYRGFATSGTAEAAEWIRGGVGSLKQYIDYVQRNGWSDNIFAVLGRGEDDLFRFIARCIASAKKGIVILAECSPEVRDEDRGEFEALCSSARLALRMMVVADLWSRARVHLEGVRQSSSGDIRTRLARLSVSEMEEAAREHERFREEVLEMPHDHVDFGRMLQFPKHPDALESIGHGVNLEQFSSEVKLLKGELEGLGLL